MHFGQKREVHGLLVNVRVQTVFGCPLVNNWFLYFVWRQIYLSFISVQTQSEENKTNLIEAYEKLMVSWSVLFEQQKGKVTRNSKQRMSPRSRIEAYKKRDQTEMILQANNTWPWCLLWKWKISNDGHINLTAAWTLRVFVQRSDSNFSCRNEKIWFGVGAENSLVVSLRTRRKRSWTVWTPCWKSRLWKNIAGWVCWLRLWFLSSPEKFWNTDRVLEANSGVTELVSKSLFSTNPSDQPYWDKPELSLCLFERMHRYET